MRLEILRRTDLALRAVRLLHEGSDRIKASALSEGIGTTAHFLPQVLSPLVHAGWVASVPGPHGGYELRRDVHGISVLELIEAVEGPVDVQTCVLRGASCGVGEPCALHGPWSRARDALLGELASTSVIDEIPGAREEGEAR